MFPPDFRQRNSPDVVVKRRTEIEGVFENMRLADPRQFLVQTVDAVQNLSVLGDVQDGDPFRVEELTHGEVAHHVDSTLRNFVWINIVGQFECELDQTENSRDEFTQKGERTQNLGHRGIFGVDRDHQRYDEAALAVDF